MVGLQEQLEGLNTDAHAIEINGLGELSNCIFQSHSSPFYVPETFRGKLLMTHRKIPLSLQALAGSAFK